VVEWTTDTINGTFEMSRAVILLSGGLDSATVAAIAKKEGHELFALTLDYGQRHRIEIEAAKKIAEHLGVAQHVIMPLDFRLFGGSSLTGEMKVPKDVPLEQIGQTIPNTSYQHGIPSSWHWLLLTRNR